MSENEFNVLKHLQKAKAQSTPVQIEELRELAKKLLKANNKLVEDIWSINLQLSKVQNGEQTRELLGKKTALQQQIEEEGYPAKIAELTQTIHELEMQEYGKSDYGDDSVYKL